MASISSGSTTAQPRENTCPLCGGDNACAMAAGEPAESCWCQAVSLSPDALSAIPASSLGKHCICARCGRVSRESLDAR
ncbi:MAG: cysteine-rich CWC family protein [Halioglobus sp.]